MSEFQNVTIAKQANVYFNGQVTCRKITFVDGSSKTLGIMMPGEYEFGTVEKELMEITSGELDVLLPGQTEWQRIVAGESFAVPADAKFQLKITVLTDYCCSYFK